MADEKDFAKELNALITRYIEGGCDPQDIADELLREANSVFGHYTLEIYLEAKPAAGSQAFGRVVLGACRARLALRPE